LIGFILTLSLRRLAFRKSTLLLLGLNLLTVLLAVIFRLSDPDADPEEWMALLMSNMVLTLVVPLTAVILGTSVFGDELEEGTSVYLLTKPIPRWQILLPQVVAAWLLTVALCLPTMLIAGYIALEEGSALLHGFGAGVVAASLAYVTLFVLLSVVTSHALIAGLVYIFLWEGVLAGIFEGIRYLAIRYYAMGIADWIADPPPDVFDAYVGGATALVLLLVVTVAAAALAKQRFERLEIREPA
jgi:ABC-2 type transport system permease protein